jgi:hypothetical protein
MARLARYIVYIVSYVLATNVCNVCAAPARDDSCSNLADLTPFRIAAEDQDTDKKFWIGTMNWISWHQLRLIRNYRDENYEWEYPITFYQRNNTLLHCFYGRTYIAVTGIDDVHDKRILLQPESYTLDEWTPIHMEQRQDDKVVLSWPMSPAAYGPAPDRTKLCWSEVSRRRPFDQLYLLPESLAYWPNWPKTCHGIRALTKGPLV